MEQRLQCKDCMRVRYRVDKMDVVSVALPAREKPADPTKTNDGELKREWEDVALKTCLDTLTAPEGLEYFCPSCGRGVVAVK
jgi:ubiquitin carboxyl-terminal hydrolase 5/13